MPKTRSGRRSRPSVEEEEEEQLQTQLPTLEEQDEEEPAPLAKKPPAAAASATKNDPPPPQAKKAPPPTAGNKVPPQPDETIHDEEDEDGDEDEALKPPAQIRAKPAAREPEEEEAPTADEISALAAKHIDTFYRDVIDYEQELIMTDRASRKTHFVVLEHFLENYTYSAREYGRVYVRTKMCMLLIDACAEPGYSVTDTSLMAWNGDDWNELLEDLELVKAACLRADCRALMPAVADAATDEERAELDCFTKRLEMVKTACEVNQLLAAVRPKLEKQIAAGYTGTPALNPSKVANILIKARDSNCSSIQSYIYKLFEPDEDAVVDDNTDDSEEQPMPKPILKNLEDLKEILSVKPFDLKWFQDRLESLVCKWNEACFGRKQPRLMAMGYKRREAKARNSNTTNRLARQTTPRSRLGETRLKELSSLKRGREALRERHGEDPLETSRELAEQATGIARAASKKQRTETPGRTRFASSTDDEEDKEERAQNSAASIGRKTKPAITLDDSDDDDGDDEEFTRARARLRRIPDRRESNDSASKYASNRIYKGPPPDEGIFDESGNVIQRHPWTGEECDALVAGLEKFGVGKWVQIKNEYGEILRNRNSVQVKDKYRNMKRKGELPDRFQ